MKKYVCRLIGILLLALLITASWNYFFDTSGLYNQEFSVKRVEPNQHFVKMRYVLSNPQKYNAFCFGSSRVGNIDLEKIDNGLNYYNMTYSEGVPAEWLADVQAFVNHGIAIKQLILGIDDFSFRVNPNLHKEDWLRIPYIDGMNLSTYLSYLFRMPAKYDKSANEKGSIYDIYGTGRPLHLEVDVQIEEDIKKHLSAEKFQKPTHYEGNRIQETIEELRQLKTICDSNGVELIVFVNPINAVTYRDTNMQEFNEFKFQLAQVTDYYDFSGLNNITTNNYYYYETSHYRPLVGDMIINRLFNKGNADFGVYVTKDNVGEHLKKLEKQLE